MSDISKSFESLPIGQLICTPILEVAKGQSELCRVYLQHLFSLAFIDGDPEKGVNSIKFKLNRQVVDTETGDSKLQEIDVEAPIIALVPVPAFTMQEATVRFSMEIKEVATDKSTHKAEAGFDAGFSRWGFSAKVNGKVSTSKENTRTSDHSAKYEIYARASQQMPAEGMSKLSQIFASVIEPIEVG
ncbi:MAG: DUF2589 domain-containing protein [Defluviitaleaceae bacterium]|nr:DUF2589 domain-containing protein [Defluviitaleaceae bacterium]